MTMIFRCVTVLRNTISGLNKYGSMSWLSRNNPKGRGGEVLTDRGRPTPCILPTVCNESILYSLSISLLVHFFVRIFWKKTSRKVVFCLTHELVHDIMKCYRLTLSLPTLHENFALSPGSQLVYLFCSLFMFVCSTKCTAATAGGASARWWCIVCYRQTKESVPKK